MYYLFLSYYIYIYIYTHTHVNLVYNNQKKKKHISLHIFYLGANTFIYFIWEQTYHNKEINSCLNTFYIFYLGTNISQQSIKIFTKKKRSIKFIPQYIFICLKFFTKKKSIKFIPHYISIYFI